MHGPHYDARLGSTERGGGTRDAEVSHLHPAVRCNQHVLGLDVAMNEAFTMCAAATARARRAPIATARSTGSGASSLITAFRSRPGTYSSTRKWLSFILADIVDPDNTGVVERGRRTGFRTETGEKLWVSRILATQYLDGNRPAELGILRSPDNRHPALADDVEEAVAILEQFFRPRRLGAGA